MWNGGEDEKKKKIKNNFQISNFTQLSVCLYTIKIKVDLKIQLQSTIGNVQAAKFLFT